MSCSEPSRIPILSLAPEIEALRDELVDAFRRVLDSGQFILGPEVEALENEVAGYLGVEHAVGVNSGTDALVIILRSLGIGAGHEVITTPFTFFATGESIALVGATPVFVDVVEDSFDIDPTRIENAIGPATRAVMPVHLYGRPCDMGPIMEIADRRGLKVIEDCAQSFGARSTGSIGHAGAFSFFPTKNLGGFGDGGLIATNDPTLADAARMLRMHGSRRRYENEVLGYNSRLDAIQAALLRVKLAHVDDWNQRRRGAARRYNALFANVSRIITPEVTDEHVFHQYTIRVHAQHRDAIRAHLSDCGIDTMIYYPTPLDATSVFADQSAPQPVSRKLSTEVVSLPIGPFIDPADQERVVDEIRTALMHLS